LAKNEPYMDRISLGGMREIISKNVSSEGVTELGTLR